jgi:hypothetical protein
MPVLLLFVASNFKANDLEALPSKIQFNHRNFAAILVDFDKLTNDKNVTKVCACQLLSVNSGNREVSNVAVFSEKINNGDLSADFAVATEVLENERKHMKSFFYDKVKIIAKQVVATDCRTMYNQLKVQYDDLKMYEVLDADAISRFKQFNK